MKRILLFVALTIIVFTSVIFYIDAAPQSDNSRQKLEIELSRAITENRNREMVEIRFSDLFTFPWEKVYFFGPYTPSSRIDYVLHTIWVRSRFLTLESSEDITLIVFVKGIQIVEYLEFPRNLGDFADLEEYKEGFSIFDANFIVSENGKINWTGHNK